MPFITGNYPCMVQFSWSSDCKCLLSVQSQLNAVCFSLKLIWFSSAVILEVLPNAAQFSICTHQERSFWCDMHGAELVQCSHLLQARSAVQKEEKQHIFSGKSPAIALYWKEALLKAVTTCKCQKKGQGGLEYGGTVHKREVYQNTLVGFKISWSRCKEA